MPTSTDNPQFMYLPIPFFINAAKVQITEQKTKFNKVFLEFGKYVTYFLPKILTLHSENFH